MQLATLGAVQGLETASPPFHPLSSFPDPSITTGLTPDINAAIEDAAAEARLVQRGLLRAVKRCKLEAEERERLVVERYLVSLDRKRVLAEVREAMYTNQMSSIVAEDGGECRSASAASFCGIGWAWSAYVGDFRPALAAQGARVHVERFGTSGALAK